MKNIKSEQGFALLNSLIFLLFLGLMAITLVVLIIADSRMQTINMDEPRAFYAAQSGIEYALRGIFEQAPLHNSLSFLNGYREILDTGSGSRARITIYTFGTDSLAIESIGISQHYAKTVVKSLNYTDVSKFAVYASGSVQFVKTIPSGLIKSHAKHMPKFDEDELRDMAKPTQYYPGDLIINTKYFFTKHISFVENNLTFGESAWLNSGNFVIGNRTTIKKSKQLLAATLGNIFMPHSGSYFLSEVQPLWRELDGGLIVNGNVKGTTVPWWLYRFAVRHNRNIMNRFLKKSLNGGPIVVNKSRWKITKH